MATGRFSGKRRASMSTLRGSALFLVFLFLTAPASAADPSALELVGTISLKGKAGNLDHLAYDAKRDRLLVANKTNNTLDVVDLKAGKLLKQITGQGGIQGIAYAADLDKIFVGLGSGGYCNVFDGESLKLVGTAKFKDDSDNVRYNPRTHLVYVAHAENELGVIDAKTNKVKTNVKLPGQAEAFQLETGRPRLYLNVPSPSQVVVIDTEKNEVITNYPVKKASGGHPMALDEAGHRIFVGCRKEPMVVVLDSETGKEIAGVSIPADVDDLFLDAKRKRLYASCGEGFLVVIKQGDGDKYEVVEKIPTTRGARTSLFVPATDRLYLAVPRQEGKEGPEIRIYKVRD
jgi:DNA-binding beta-propeller fold protein YncE